MPKSLAKELRKLLEKNTAEARILAESACRAALENLAVHEKDYRPHMTEDQRRLRNRLRARGRALGDARDPQTGIQEIHHLCELAAYETWHRLLFTRFLTENNLLIADEANGSIAVTLEECEELAPELGARDGFDLACRFAGQSLPGVFRKDDPVLELPIALNDQVELRKLLANLPAECFLTDDGLGWTYQFWQAKRKDEVNASGKKIGADEIAPVTQLFTEDYMVEFLLHNTLGAWWAGKIGPIHAATEEEARSRAALPARDGVPAITWTYLRFVQDETTKTWSPAAGTFEGWPKWARLIRLLDPCMGSGHFLVFALPILVRLRMEEENLSAQAALVAVLEGNIYGLELDERCTQIAAFNVALTAWKLVGYQTLPSLNLACSGLAPCSTEAEWIGLAGEDYRLQAGMLHLHRLFQSSPLLGSLINPRTLAGNLIEAEFQELQSLLSEVLLTEDSHDDDHNELGVVAEGLAKAAEILADQFTLVATNVPYLVKGKQCDVMRCFIADKYPHCRPDLAVAFLERCREFSFHGGTYATVSPQNWLYLSTYSPLRKLFLTNQHLDHVSKLGSGASATESWEVLRTLSIISNCLPTRIDSISGVDAPYATDDEKATQLRSGSLIVVNQDSQSKNPDYRIILSKELRSSVLLSDYARAYQGIATGDYSRFGRCFWEMELLGADWMSQHSTFAKTDYYSGLEHILYWQGGKGELAASSQARVQGLEAITRKGVVVSQMRSLPVSIFNGSHFDNNVSALVSIDPENLGAIWTFCSSPDYNEEVRKIDQKLSVTNATLTKVPFDLVHWQKVAAEKYPNGLPKPHSAEPTQWLFNGHPAGSTQPLHVSVARLLGYIWPRQTGSSFPDCPSLGPDGLESFSDEDGIVCLPPLNREQNAAARLRKILTALGTFDERALVSAAGLKGSKSKTLEDWLRDEFFDQHTKLFHNRPFIWHLWDGRTDGFNVLVNYHKLDHAALQKLTYSYLGDWIRQQDEDATADKPGAAERLGAARNLQIKLAAILEGEAPLDIFVRWKSIKDQAMGWQPDLNDGIRQNIRPFLFAGDVGKKGAGLFRTVPLSLKDKDRGTEPTRPREDYPWFWCKEEPGTDPIGGDEFVGNRWNNVHLTLATKRKARS